MTSVPAREQDPFDLREGDSERGRYREMEIQREGDTERGRYREREIQRE